MIAHMQDKLPCGETKKCEQDGCTVELRRGLRTAWQWKKLRFCVKHCGGRRWRSDTEQQRPQAK